MVIHIDDENLAIYKVLEQIHHKTNNLSLGGFRSLVCMVIEEYCKENGLDAVKETKECLSAVEFVNAAYGKY